MRFILCFVFSLSVGFSYAQSNEWEDPYSDCNVVEGKYRIHFFTTRAKCTKDITFPYYIEDDNIYKRYYYIDELTYCEALEVLEFIKYNFPDAYPKKIKNEKD